MRQDDRIGPYPDTLTERGCFQTRSFPGSQTLKHLLVWNCYFNEYVSPHDVPQPIVEGHDGFARMKHHLAIPVICSNVFRTSNQLPSDALPLQFFTYGYLPHAYHVL